MLLQCPLASGCIGFSQPPWQLICVGPGWKSHEHTVELWDLQGGQGLLCKDGDPKGVASEVCCSSSCMVPQAASTFPLPEGTSKSKQGERAIIYDFTNALGAALQRQVSKRTHPQEEILLGLARPPENTECLQKNVRKHKLLPSKRGKTEQSINVMVCADSRQG